MLEWTGERYLPWLQGAGAAIHYEHLQRYAFARQLAKGKRVLDLGCGEGYGSYLMSKEAAGVVGVDLDADAVNHAARRYSHACDNLRFLQGSATDVPIGEPHVFDLIVCFETLEHVEDHEALLSEVKRLLKADGTFVVSTPNKRLYTDKPRYQNPFHRKELYLDEFERLLVSRFKHVKLLGQKVYTGSFFWSLRAPGGPATQWTVERTPDGYRQAEPERKEPMYFIGLGSAEALSSVPGSDSCLLDVSDRYLEDYLESFINPKIQNLTDEVAQLRSGQQRYETEINRLSGLVEVREQELARLRADGQRLDVQLSSADEEAARVSALMNERESEIEGLQDRIRQLMAHCQSHESEARVLAARLDETKARLRQANDSLGKLAAEGQSQVSETSFLATRLDETETRLRFANDSLNRLTEELFESQRSVKEMRSTKSWGVTKPLRWLSAAVRGLSGNPVLEAVIDQPSLTENHIYGLLEISGWAAGSQPVVRIEIWFDNEPIGTCGTEVPRPDVAAARPDLPDAARAGFAFVWNAERVARGPHKLVVRAIDTRGQVAEKARLVEVESQFHINMDEPSADALVAAAEIDVVGWAAGPCSVARVEVLRDGVRLAVGEVGLPRPDVAAMHPHLRDVAHSGFALRLDGGHLSPGPVELVVQAVDIRDRTATMTRPIVVKAAAEPIRVIAAAENDGPPVHRGDPARSAEARGGSPRGRPTWRRFALYTSSLGNYFFGEIRDLIASGLEELGFSVELRDERYGFSQDADWHMVIAPHEFFYLGVGSGLLEEVPSQSILLNTEQPATQWFARAAGCFPRAYAIWDINAEAASVAAAHGHRCSHLPLGYTPRFDAATKVDVLPQHYATCLLDPEVCASGAAGASFAERPIDVMFVGHVSPRRERFFAGAASVLSRHHCYLHFSDASRPVIPGRTTNMGTPTVYGLAQRSKILLNIHHGDDRYFEWHRIVMLGVWQGALVITEPCGVSAPFHPGIDFVEASLDRLPETIEYYLSTDQGRAEAEQIVRNGFRTLTERCRLADSLRELILELKDVPRLPERFDPQPAAERLADHLDLFATAPFVERYPLLPPVGVEEIKRAKIGLTAGVGRADSIRDYGGLWGVFGDYLLQGATALDCRYAHMIDVTPRQEFWDKVRELQAGNENLRVEMSVADFRDPEVYSSLDVVDVSLLYEVLLHQDNPEEVLKRVLLKTRKCVCVAQPVLKEDLFSLPGGAVCLQFYPEQLKDLLRTEPWWSKEPPTDRFDTRYWMWGQTVSYFKSVFFGYGFELEHVHVHELSASSRYWNYALLRFVPRPDVPTPALERDLAGVFTAAS